MAKKALVKQSGGPKLKKEYPVSKYPFLIEKPYMRQIDGDVVYKSTMKAALDWVREDIRKMEPMYRALNDTSALAAMDALLDQVSQLPIFEGNRWLVEGVLDPYSGLKYKAEIVRRQG
jgi:hypothetical protein